ncbi:epoxide hydrolase N terminus-domain-containing protein [Delphinella strobiligena]|nr:epoxide hydrolase N terminus-domain-containing protein [Delphinella strobiligena]
MFGHQVEHADHGLAIELHTGRHAIYPVWPHQRLSIFTAANHEAFKLEQWKERLDPAIPPDQLGVPNHWQFGAPVPDTKRLVHDWRHGFDWRKTGKALNGLPNYTTKINVDDFGELDIHFVHQVSPIKGVIPLLFLHGCTFLLLLRGNATEPAFHVVASPLPNLGFSSGVDEKGFTLTKHAETICPDGRQRNGDSYALADSLEALLTWINEKLHDWTGVYPWTDDEILTWVSIYWSSTAGPAANLRIHYEATYPQNTVYERGEHFAAWEQPGSIVAVVKKMFGNGGSWFAIVDDKTGF